MQDREKQIGDSGKEGVKTLKREKEEVMSDSFILFPLFYPLITPQLNKKTI
jgi:hypothetical protein